MAKKKRREHNTGCLGERQIKSSRKLFFSCIQQKLMGNHLGWIWLLQSYKRQLEPLRHRLLRHVRRGLVASLARSFVVSPRTQNLDWKAVLTLNVFQFLTDKVCTYKRFLKMKYVETSLNSCTFKDKISNSVDVSGFGGRFMKSRTARDI